MDIKAGVAFLPGSGGARPKIDHIGSAVLPEPQGHYGIRVGLEESADRLRVHHLAVAHIQTRADPEAGQGHRLRLFLCRQVKNRGSRFRSGQEENHPRVFGVNYAFHFPVGLRGKLRHNAIVFRGCQLSAGLGFRPFAGEKISHEVQVPFAAVNAQSHHLGSLDPQQGSYGLRVHHFAVAHIQPGADPVFRRRYGVFRRSFPGSSAAGRACQSKSQGQAYRQNGFSVLFCSHICFLLVSYL